MKHQEAPMVFREAVAGTLRHGPSLARFKNIGTAFAAAPLAVTARIANYMLRKTIGVLPSSVGRLVGMPKLGAVRLGDLDRTHPIGEVFGGNRGRPIDRYYIENYLEENSKCIRGRVLEIEDNTYTVRFGGEAVTKGDVLHIRADYPGATITGDMTDPATLPADTFDCIILTQTLHLIYNMKSAVSALYNALAPGGVLLITVPGITPIDPAEWGESWYWSLTEPALRRVLAESFREQNLDCATFGNVFAAICFLAGLATEEVASEKLDVLDMSFPVIVAARAVKATVQ